MPIICCIFSIPTYSEAAVSEFAPKSLYMYFFSCVEIYVFSDFAIKAFRSHIDRFHPLCYHDWKSGG